MGQKRDRRKIWLLAGILFALVAVIAIMVIVQENMQRQNINDLYEEIVTEANAVSDEDLEESGTDEDFPLSGIEIPEKNLDWDALREKNADIYAWIYIPDTDVDYPVLQDPKDNSYYLNHNMDGTEGYPGCIYSEDYNKKDFSDIHTVLYGHNLKDGTMFSSLHNFEDPDLFGADHYIFVYTEEYIFVYQIFAAYEYSDIHLLDNFDYSNEYVYENFLKTICETGDRVANVRQDVAVTTEDQIITLSTCTKEHDSEQRYLVTGVLLNPRAN